MEKRSEVRRAQPDLMPWQAALMIVCVTAAGVLHEHPGAMRPTVKSLETVQGRVVVARGGHAAAVLDVVVWRGR